MRRFHSIELHEQPWFPSNLRNLLTDWMQFTINSVKIYQPMVPQIKEVLKRTESKQIIDLCSGASGPWTQYVKEGWNMPVKLTDKYPNKGTIDSFMKNSSGVLDYVTESVDATEVPAHLKGMRTIFTAFHHFRPDDARKILKDAVDQKAPIGIFEMTERGFIPIIGAAIFMPISVLLSLVFIRPVKLSRFFWTFSLVLPLLTAWDASVSVLRTYTPKELEELAESIDADEYAWEVGYLGPRYRGRVTYLLGYPKS